MNDTTDVVASPYATPSPIGDPPGSHDYLFGVGFFCIALFILTITYVTYICMKSRSTLPPTDIYDEWFDENLVSFSRGLDEDVFVTFPTFVYSETITCGKFETATDADGSGCSICLEDYLAADVVRLLPKCGHLFHVGCIDGWLKARPTCPVCRNFAGINLVEFTL